MSQALPWGRPTPRASVPGHDGGHAGFRHRCSEAPADSASVSTGPPLLAGAPRVSAVFGRSPEAPLRQEASVARLWPWSTPPGRGVEQTVPVMASTGLLPMIVFWTPFGIGGQPRGAGDLVPDRGGVVVEGVVDEVDRRGGAERDAATRRGGVVAHRHADQGERLRRAGEQRPAAVAAGAVADERASLAAQGSAQPCDRAPVVAALVAVELVVIDDVAAPAQPQGATAEDRALGRRPASARGCRRRCCRRSSRPSCAES